MAERSDRLTGVAGSLWAVLGSLLLVLVWAITGPILQLTDEVQLFVNTTMTVLTLGTVFAIQTKRQSASEADPVAGQPELPDDGRLIG